MDFNNDGYLDFVRVSTTDNNKIIVTYAEPSATNLLASIVSPTNMSIDNRKIGRASCRERV